MGLPPHNYSIKSKMLKFVIVFSLVCNIGDRMSHRVIGASANEQERNIKRVQKSQNQKFNLDFLVFKKKQKSRIIYLHI